MSAGAPTEPTMTTASRGNDLGVAASALGLRVSILLTCVFFAMYVNSYLNRKHLCLACV